MVDLTKPLDPSVTSAPMAVLFHLVVAIAVVLLIVVYAIPYIKNTVVTPTAPVGGIGLNYDTLNAGRKSLSSYLSDNKIPDNTPLVQFQVATANFGGIFTEQQGALSPWNGTVSPDAVQLQVLAGARAVVFDIWPDPANMANPVVCAMIDTSQWSIQNWWRNKGGMSQGVGTYSNWQMLTRNKVDAQTMLTAAVQTAFSSQNQQKEDPFFLILRLHGAMNTTYLNTLGAKLQSALGGHAMGTTYQKWQQQRNLCNMPVSEVLGTNGTGGFAYVIVLPDIPSSGYDVLPGVNSYSGFVTALQNTTLGELTNAVEQNLSTMFFTPGNIGPISIANQPPCLLQDGQGGAPPLTPAQAGFCIVQPSIGGQATDNGTLFKDNSFQNCQKSGAQFVAVNMFSPDSNDGVLTTWFNPKVFGTYSFLKT